MNIVTTWWKTHRATELGQWPFPITYPNALRSQVDALGHSLTVLTNTPHGRRLIEPEKYRGWWSKLEAFRPENRDLRPCLVLDLDTFVFDLEPLLELDPGQLWLIGDFFGNKNRANSGLMIVPDAPITDEIWADAQRTNLPGTYRNGDGHFLRRYTHRRMDQAVEGILSYKAHQLNILNKPPKETKIVCFHGHPRPCEVESGWAKEWWDLHAGENR